MHSRPFPFMNTEYDSTSHTFPMFFLTEEYWFTINKAVVLNVFPAFDNSIIVLFRESENINKACLNHYSTNGKLLHNENI